MRTELMERTAMVRSAAVLLSTAALISACVTLSGKYMVSVQDAQGNSLSDIMFMAQGRAVYSVRNAMCIKFPGAIVVIKDADTGEELKSESPYQCR
ncbi:MAG: hypothetical protein LBE33_11215 [Zoogloeaceae bacterium]|jgi:hypothetical protein|nr:hypothetical protein [Zoogloeaceae bacterium]